MGQHSMNKDGIDVEMLEWAGKLVNETRESDLRSLEVYYQLDSIKRIRFVDDRVNMLQNQLSRIESLLNNLNNKMHQ